MKTKGDNIIGAKIKDFMLEPIDKYLDVIGELLEGKIQRIAIGSVSEPRIELFRIDSRNILCIGDQSIFLAEEIMVKNKELVEKQAMIEDMLQNKSAFLSNITHEIRTPLNGISGMTDILLEEKYLTSDQLDYITTIKQCTNCLLAFVDDIQDFSRMEASKITLETEQVDLRELAKICRDIFSPKVQTKGIAMELKLGSGIPDYIRSDGKRIRQVIMNYLSNAFKFCHYGKITLAIDAVKIESKTTINRYNIIISVSDTGVGIPGEDIGKLFKPYSQLQTVGFEDKKGAGLGLAICQYIAELLEGMVWCESEAGKGSTFFLQFQAEEDISYDTLKEKYLPLLTGITVLVVDDNKTNRIAISSMLIEWGMVVIPIESPQEALISVRSNPSIELGLIDIRMPDMTGDTLAAKIRDIRYFPMIAITSTDISDARYDMFVSTIEKPIKKIKLLASIANILKNNNKPEEDMKKTAEMIVRGKNLKILVVEDIPDNMKVLTLFLKKLNYEDYDTASSGIDALLMVEKKKYDAILLDLKMPRMSGFEVATEINKKFGKEGRPYIIAITAITSASTMQKCKEAGMDGYLTKPINKRELDVMLDVIWGQKRKKGSLEEKRDLGRMESVTAENSG